jgi:general stress protein YciG
MVTARQQRAESRRQRSQRMYTQHLAGVSVETLAQQEDLAPEVVRHILDNAQSGVYSGLRGFASMSKERQRELASRGGHAAHAQGTAHEWTSAEAREAGRRGGQRHNLGANRRKATG